MLVAVTGNMGSGKTTFCGMLAVRGARLVDADVLARQVVEESEDLRSLLAAAFGADLLDAAGRLDRRDLAARALATESGRCQLETIVRPRLEPRIWHELADAEKDAEIVVLDAPLVFEWGIQDRFDAVVVLTAAADIAAQRVWAGRGLSPAEVSQRRAAQCPAKDLREGVDYGIDNSGSLAELEVAAQRIWLDLLHRARRP